MKRINEGSNQPKTQDGNYQEHRNKEENKEDSYIIKQLKGMRHDAPEEFIEMFGSDNIDNALNELKRGAAEAGISLVHELQIVRDQITPREDERSFYPESFDNAVNDILKGLQEHVIEEAIPAIVGAVAKKVGPSIAKHAANKLSELVGDEGESYCEDEEDGPSKMQRLQNYIDDK